MRRNSDSSEQPGQEGAVQKTKPVDAAIETGMVCGRHARSSATAAGHAQSTRLVKDGTSGLIVAATETGLAGRGLYFDGCCVSHNKAAAPRKAYSYTERAICKPASTYADIDHRCLL